MTAHLCGIKWCSREIYGEGPVCKMHYERKRCTGSYGPARSRMEPSAVMDYIWKRVDRTEPSQCWRWTGSINHSGYGQYSMGRRGEVRKGPAHRLLYETLVGPIPEGLVIDHLCRNRACVNPAHLEPVTIAENTLRGNAPSIIVARQNRCYRGHEFTPENTYIAPNSRGRHCLQCIKEWSESA